MRNRRQQVIAKRNLHPFPNSLKGVEQIRKEERKINTVMRELYSYRRRIIVKEGEDQSCCCSTERASGMVLQPSIYAINMEPMVALGQNPVLLATSYLAEAHRTVLELLVVVVVLFHMFLLHGGGGGVAVRGKDKLQPQGLLVEKGHKREGYTNNDGYHPPTCFFLLLYSNLMAKINIQNFYLAT